jgi:hypothetical protein
MIWLVGLVPFLIVHLAIVLIAASEERVAVTRMFT